jgi:hypothetical protein
MSFWKLAIEDRYFLESSSERSSGVEIMTDVATAEPVLLAPSNP